MLDLYNEAHKQHDASNQSNFVLIKCPNESYIIKILKILKFMDLYNEINKTKRRLEMFKQ